ncbi:hypothetical protein DDE18_20010 [Nocardioides gansuensis]|uniref:Uncharacterized protein n=1 Tax=Nocardioides gansuensis TaxID=2138300 RepID=A0A2T8F5V8_9ACTN|nr:hypothetical protein [Nocardioides gansuensis]PVG81096.1 hypothetical protein DDE18_20010 [Nocardioides gansuensis]
MTWKSFHRRGEVLREVIAVADARRDGRLPLDVAGVRETFTDELDLLGALQLRWHTRLAGRIERELMVQPMDLEAAVVAAWHGAADEIPGIRAILDHYSAAPTSEEVARAIATANAKEHGMLAVMSGKAAIDDALAARVGAQIAERAHATYAGPAAPQPTEPLSLVDRLRAVIAA